jgi:hypothetical protein
MRRIAPRRDGKRRRLARDSTMRRRVAAARRRSHEATAANGGNIAPSAKMAVGVGMAAAGSGRRTGLAVEYRPPPSGMTS